MFKTQLCATLRDRMLFSTRPMKVSVFQTLQIPFKRVIHSQSVKWWQSYDERFVSHFGILPKVLLNVQRQRKRFWTENIPGHKQSRENHSYAYVRLRQREGQHYWSGEPVLEIVIVRSAGTTKTCMSKTAYAEVVLWLSKNLQPKATFTSSAWSFYQTWRNRWKTVKYKSNSFNLFLNWIHSLHDNSMMEDLCPAISVYFPKVLNRGNENDFIILNRELTDILRIIMFSCSR